MKLQPQHGSEEWDLISYCDSDSNILYFMSPMNLTLTLATFDSDRRLILLYSVGSSARNLSNT